jgi:ADP-ribose pyrophosphatase YjhB (NUDIX family)
MPKVRVSVKAIIKREHQLLVTRNVAPDGEFFLLPGGGQKHGEALPEALHREVMEEVGAPIEVHELALVRDYIARNHEFADQGDGHQLELFFRCSLLVDTVPANGPHPDGWQIGVQWLDLESQEATRLYPKVLQRILLIDDPSQPIYLGDVN